MDVGDFIDMIYAQKEEYKDRKDLSKHGKFEDLDLVVSLDVGEKEWPNGMYNTEEVAIGFAEVSTHVDWTPYIILGWKIK